MNQRILIALTILFSVFATDVFADENAVTTLLCEGERDHYPNGFGNNSTSSEDSFIVVINNTDLTIETDTYSTEKLVQRKKLRFREYSKEINAENQINKFENGSFIVSEQISIDRYSGVIGRMIMIKDPPAIYSVFYGKCTAKKPLF